MVRLLKPDRPRGRNYLSRREQWRLLLLFVPLALVIVVIGKLRDPATANRINQAFAQAAGGVGNPPVAEPADSSRSVGLFAGVDPQWLKTITDNTYFRNAESNAWFSMFGLLQHASAEDLQAAHGIEASYVQLVDQPNFYRGKLVTVYGYPRQITEQTPAANDLGIKSYYRIAVQPTDGSAWPIFVYCLELPPNLSLRDTPSGGYLKVTGLFFKKLSYEWRDGLGTAPVIVSKDVEYYASTPCGPVLLDIHPPAASDAWKNPEPSTSAETNANAADTTKPTTSFREILTLAGWDAKRLAEFDDGQPLSDPQRVKALELLRRIRSFNSADLDAWVHEDLSPYEAVKHAADDRGRLVRLNCSVTRVTVQKPAPADATRLEMPAYYECEIALDNQAGIATVLTTRVPTAWLNAEKLDEPVSAIALYVKKLGDRDSPPTLWLAKEIAWHPGQSTEKENGRSSPTIDEGLGNAADRTFGTVILGSLGMDVGLLDQVQSRGPIRAEERDALYGLLKAVGHVGPHQLARFAQQNLPAFRDEWKRRLTATDIESHRALAQEVLRLAAKGRYSVAPLFNDAPHQQGRLFVFDGMARRAVRVEVGTQSGGGSSDSARRFGFDHYYEVEVFTDDSQNNPLVFCVRELPDGFPVGDALREPVRVAGFFFKDWRYRARDTAEDDDQHAPDEAAGDVDPSRYAPLLIGRAPLRLPPEQGGSLLSQYVGGGLFLLGLAGVWIAAVLYSRGDRQFRRRTPAVDLSLPPGQSLNDLHVAAADRPMNLADPNLPTTNETT
jgi:hypothetical protein